jgi:hypothetical protein
MLNFGLHLDDWCDDCQKKYIICPNCGEDRICPCDDHASYCKGKQENKMNKQSMTRRFYATSSAVEYSPILKTYSEALSDAQSKLLDDNSKANKLGEIYIVEVIKIVKLSEPEPVRSAVEVIEIRR